MKNFPGFFLIGPLVLVVLVVCFALVFVFAALIGRERAVTLLIERAANRLNTGGISLLLWGFVRIFLIIVLTILAWRIHPAIGCFIIAIGLGLLGICIAVAAIHIGHRWPRPQYIEEDESTQPGFVSFSNGLWLIAGASAVPIVGWLICVVEMFAASGAVAEAFVHRTR